MNAVANSNEEASSVTCFKYQMLPVGIAVMYIDT